MRKHIIIQVDDSEKYEVGKAIHDQLVGNPDYVESNILLNIDEPGTISLWVLAEAKPCEIKLAL